MEGVGDESSKAWRGWRLPSKFSGFGTKIQDEYLPHYVACVVVELHGTGVRYSQ
jgi:hypothetical protein